MNSGFTCITNSNNSNIGTSRLNRIINFKKAFYQRGYFKLNLDDYAGAIADFDNALKLDKKMGKAFYYRGLANAKSGNLSESANGFFESANLGYKSHESYFNAGLAYLQLKKTTEARRALENCIKANSNGPKTMDARINLGALELMNSNFDKAIKIYTDILKSYSKNTVAPPHSRWG